MLAIASANKTRTAFRMMVMTLLPCEHLIGVRIRCRTLHPVEAEVRRLMAVVARLREAVVRRCERRRVFLVDRRLEFLEGPGDHPGNRVLRCDRRLLVRRVELDDVVEAFAQLLQ